MAALPETQIQITCVYRFPSMYLSLLKSIFLFARDSERLALMLTLGLHITSSLKSQ